MKAFFKIISVFLFLMIFSMFTTSCEKNGIDAGVKEASVLDEKMGEVSKAQETCCTVTCRRGNCTVNSSPCSCTSLGGQPICSSTGSNSRTVITASEDIMISYDNLASYIQSIGAPQVADAILDIKELFVTNHFELSSLADIKKYDELLNIYIEFYKSQSVAVQDKMEEL